MISCRAKRFEYKMGDCTSSCAPPISILQNNKDPWIVSFVLPLWNDNKAGFSSNQAHISRIKLSILKDPRLLQRLDISCHCLYPIALSVARRADKVVLVTTCFLSTHNNKQQTTFSSAVNSHNQLSSSIFRLGNRYHNDGCQIRARAQSRPSGLCSTTNHHSRPRVEFPPKYNLSRSRRHCQIRVSHAKSLRGCWKL